MESDYYLFASQSAEAEQTARTVFYRLKGDSIARALCDLFNNQFAQSGETFTFERRKAFSVSNQVLLDEAIEALELYDDPRSRHLRSASVDVRYNVGPICDACSDMGAFIERKNA